MQKSLVCILAILLTAACFAAQEDTLELEYARERELVDAVGCNQNQDVERLLSQEVDPNLTAQAGHSLLMVATWWGNYEIVDSLLKHGADPNYQNDYGDTALIIACCLRHENIISRLIKANADPNILNSDCRNALDCVSGLTLEKNGSIELYPHRAYMEQVKIRERPTGMSKEAVELRKAEQKIIKKIKNFLLPNMVLGPTRLVAAIPEHDQKAPEDQSWWSAIRVDYALMALVVFSLFMGRTNRGSCL